MENADRNMSQPTFPPSWHLCQRRQQETEKNLLAGASRVHTAAEKELLLDVPFYTFPKLYFSVDSPIRLPDKNEHDILRLLILKNSNIWCPLRACVCDPSSMPNEKHTNTNARPHNMFVSSQKLVNYDSTLCLNEPRGLSIWFHSFNLSLPQPIPFLPPF